MVMRKFPCYRLVFLVKCRIPFWPFIWAPSLTFSDPPMAKLFQSLVIFLLLGRYHHQFQSCSNYVSDGEGRLHPLPRMLFSRCELGQRRPPRPCDITTSLQVSIWQNLWNYLQVRRIHLSEPWLRAGSSFKDLTLSVSWTTWIMPICRLSATQAKYCVVILMIQSS